MDSLFAAAVAFVQQLPPPSSLVQAQQRLLPSASQEQQLRLYALYKQATMGPCTGARPWTFEFVAQAKWDAWNAVSNLDKITAAREYVLAVVNLLESVPVISDEDTDDDPEVRQKLASLTPPIREKTVSLIKQSRIILSELKLALQILQRPSTSSSSSSSSLSASSKSKQTASSPSASASAISPTSKSLSGSLISKVNQNTSEVDDEDSDAIFVDRVSSSTSPSSSTDSRHLVPTKSGDSINESNSSSTKKRNKADDLAAGVGLGLYDSSSQHSQYRHHHHREEEPDITNDSPVEIFATQSDLGGDEFLSDDASMSSASFIEKSPVSTTRSNVNTIVSKNSKTQGYGNAHIERPTSLPFASLSSYSSSSSSSSATVAAAAAVRKGMVAESDEDEDQANDEQDYHSSVVRPVRSASHRALQQLSEKTALASSTSQRLEEAMVLANSTLQRLENLERSVRSLVERHAKLTPPTNATNSNISSSNNSGGSGSDDDGSFFGWIKASWQRSLKHALLAFLIAWLVHLFHQRILWLLHVIRQPKLLK